MEQFRKGFVPPAEPGRIVAGIVPHAGWFFSGATAAKVFLSIHARQKPKTFILFGAIHVPGVRKNSVYPEGEWATPFGPVKVDADAARLFLERCPKLLAAEPGAHAFEHSIEVQTPMIKRLFPDAMILPIAVPPGNDAVGLGTAVGDIVLAEKMDAVVVGSTDLTHYGDNYGFSPAGYGKDAYDWMLGNDGRIIELALKLDAPGVLREAAANQNACGPGAMAAAVSAAKALGSRGGILLEHTTSYDIYPQGGFDMAVGYAGIIY